MHLMRAWLIVNTGNALQLKIMEDCVEAVLSRGFKREREAPDTRGWGGILRQIVYREAYITQRAN